MRSLLHTENPPFELPDGCSIGSRVEIPVAMKKNGRIYRLVLRDKIVPEDILVLQIKAIAFAIQQGEPYMGRPIPRAVKDFLIKRNTVI